MTRRPNREEIKFTRETGRFVGQMHNGEAREYLNGLCDMAMALLDLEEKSGWQPIETAPKDEKLILLWEPGSVLYQGCWQNGFGWIGFTKAADVNPTHWMPLPSPPTGSTTGGK